MHEYNSIHIFDTIFSLLGYSSVEKMFYNLQFYDLPHNSHIYEVWKVLAMCIVVDSIVASLVVCISVPFFATLFLPVVHDQPRVY